MVKNKMFSILWKEQNFLCNLYSKCCIECEKKIFEQKVNKVQNCFLSFFTRFTFIIVILWTNQVENYHFVGLYIFILPTRIAIFGWHFLAIKLAHKTGEECAWMKCNLRMIFELVFQLWNFMLFDHIFTPKCCEKKKNCHQNLRWSCFVGF